jgi:uncharacterized protein (DUF1778 family)
MGVVNPRGRVITFRLSNTEYELVLRAAKGSGARSLSDFGRGAVLDRAQVPTQIPKGSDSDHEQLRVLSERSERLFHLLHELNQRLSALHDSSAEAKPRKINGILHATLD